MTTGLSGNTIAISGSTGFIGRLLADWLGRTNRVIALEREDFGRDKGKLAQKIAEAEIIINLAGSPIIKRWTKRNRRIIYDSRIGTTEKLVESIGESRTKCNRFISASAIGIYSERGKHTEDSGNFAGGFMKHLIRDWERAALTAGRYCESVGILRFGIVLGKDGGMLKKMLPLFRMGLGGRIGSGEQYLSFIHLDDLMRSMVYVLEKKLGGTFNVVAPNPVTNREFTDCLASLLKRPAFLVAPDILLKLWLGAGASSILNGPFVLPEKLQDSGFRFNFATIGDALRDIIGK